MEKTSSALNYLSLEEYIKYNGVLLSLFGGLLRPNNQVLNPNSLEYLIEIISIEVGEIVPFPTIFDKAAAIAFHTINDHIFVDGNKRTGMFIASLFLKMNGCNEKRTLKSEALANLALDIEGDKIDIKKISKWYYDNHEQL